MHDEILKKHEIYMQDVICDAVLKYLNSPKRDPRDDSFTAMAKIYNYLIMTGLETPSFETALRVMELIKINQHMLRIEGI